MGQQEELVSGTLLRCKNKARNSYLSPPIFELLTIQRGGGREVMRVNMSVHTVGVLGVHLLLFLILGAGPAALVAAV